MKLGADRNRVRQQVIELLHGYQGKELEPGRWPPREGALVLRCMLAWTRFEGRLAAPEQRVGTGPDTSDLDEQIDKVRGERQAAADVQEYQQARVAA